MKIRNSANQLKRQLPPRLASLRDKDVKAVREQLEGKEYVPGELLVKVKPGPGLSEHLASQYDGEVVEVFDQLSTTEGQLVRLTLPEGVEVAEAMAAMKQDRRIAYAEQNEIIRMPEVQASVLSGTPNDLDEQLWGLHNTGQEGGKPGADISALEAWQTTVGDNSAEGPIIAVIDTGVDYEHPDLKANIWVNPGEIPGNGIDDDGNGVVDDVHGFDAVSRSGDPRAGNRHGTHVAGTIGAVGDNGQGLTGVMQKARLMPIKIFPDSGGATAAAIVRGLNYSAKMGATITNNSWGGGSYQQSIYDAFAAHPGLHIIAAGNSAYDNDKRDNFPSNFDLDSIVAVAATDRHDELAYFSQWGKRTVDVAAPGRDITSTLPGGSYGSLSGTSMATPHVAGVAGLIASAHPEATAAEIKDRLIYGSDRIEQLGHLTVSGGRVNAASALENDQSSPAQPGQLAVSNTDTRGATLSWTAPADDGQSGEPALVEWRVSQQPINEQNYQQAQLFGEAVGPVGEIIALEFTTPPSTSARQVYFGGKAIDNVGNRSDLVAGSTVLPAARLELEEGFEESTHSFQGEGDFRRVGVDGRGMVFSSTPSPGEPEAALSALTSPRIPLEGKKNAYLKFDARSHLYWGNTATVEASVDGQTWSQLHEFKRRQDWSEHGLDLSAFDGQSVRVRFTVDSEWGRDREGLSVDNVRILAESGSGEAVLKPQADHHQSRHPTPTQPGMGGHTDSTPADG